MEELKKCKCGAQPEYVTYLGLLRAEGFGIECPKCKVHTKKYDKQFKAKRAWNKMQNDKE